jgi:hypothetical protein
VSRRASLPGAEELFRRTTEREPRREQPEKQDDKSTKLQVASTASPAETDAKKGPKHDEKVTFYCTGEDLMALERARLKLRSEHGVAADRGRIVRAALGYVLEDFEARADDSILLRRLSE